MVYWVDYSGYTACLDSTPHWWQCARVCTLAAAALLSLVLVEVLFVRYIVSSPTYAGYRMFLFSSIVLSLCAKLLYEAYFTVVAVRNLTYLLSVTQLLVITLFFASFALRARNKRLDVSENTKRVLWVAFGVVELAMIGVYVGGLLGFQENCWDVPVLIFTSCEIVSCIALLASGLNILRKLSETVLDQQAAAEYRRQLMVVVGAYALGSSVDFCFQLVRAATFSRHELSYASNSDQVRTCVSDNWSTEMSLPTFVAALAYETVTYFLPLWAIAYSYAARASRRSTAARRRDSSMRSVGDMSTSPINSGLYSSGTFTGGLINEPRGARGSREISVGPSVTPAHVMAGRLPPLPTDGSLASYGEDDG